MRPDQHWDASHYDITIRAMRYYNILKEIAGIDATWPKNKPYNLTDDCAKVKRIIGEIQDLARKAVGK